MSYDSERPEIKMPYSKLEKLVLYTTVLVFIYMIVSLIFNWGDLPKEIPSHFNALGEVDKVSGKGFLIMFPIFALIVLGPCYLISFFPTSFNFSVKITISNAENQYRNAREMLFFMNLEIVAFFAYLQYSTINIAKGKGDSLGVFSVGIFLIVLFGTLGYKIWKMYKLK